MSDNLKINEILERIHSAAGEAGVELTFVHSKVYLQLLEYSKEPYVKALENGQGVRFYVAPREFAKYCSVSARLVFDSLQKFDKCGVIQYTPSRRSKTVVKLYKKFYE